MYIRVVENELPCKACYNYFSGGHLKVISNQEIIASRVSDSIGNHLWVPLLSF